MSNIYITKLPRICDFKIEIFLTQSENSEIEAMREAAKMLQREVIRRESRSH